MTYKDLREFVQSKLFQGMLIGFSIGLIMFLVFQAGVFVGYRKAAFSYHFGDNYYRAFDHRGPEGKFFQKMGGPFPDDLIEGHGAVGKVMSINLPVLVVSGPDDVEKSVLIGEDTVVRRFRDEMSKTDIAVGDFLVVLGEPNEESQIEAKLIRILPPPPTS